MSLPALPNQPAVFALWPREGEPYLSKTGLLRRRLLRWVAWKEKDVLAPDEYAELTAYWERRLRQLANRLHTLGGGDEETLDHRLSAVRDWLQDVGPSAPVY